MEDFNEKQRLVYELNKSDFYHEIYLQKNAVCGMIY